MPGLCAAGLTECAVNGAPTCKQQQMPRPETCNNADKDCNGLVDDGDLCPTDEVCVRGKCVARCNTGEFACPPDLVCGSDGFCIDPACRDVTCEPGLACRAGRCVGVCESVVCPLGQVCQLDRCIDPCVGVICPEMTFCSRGVCVGDCTCNGCPAGEECAPDGRAPCPAAPASPARRARPAALERACLAARAPCARAVRSAWTAFAASPRLAAGRRVRSVWNVGNRRDNHRHGRSGRRQHRGSVADGRNGGRRSDGGTVRGARSSAATRFPATTAARAACRPLARARRRRSCSRSRAPCCSCGDAGARERGGEEVARRVARLRVVGSSPAAATSRNLASRALPNCASCHFSRRSTSRAWRRGVFPARSGVGRFRRDPLDPRHALGEPRIPLFSVRRLDLGDDPPGHNFPRLCDGFDRTFLLSLDDPTDPDGEPPGIELVRAITPFGGPPGRRGHHRRCERPPGASTTFTSTSRRGSIRRSRERRRRRMDRVGPHRPRAGNPTSFGAFGRSADVRKPHERELGPLSFTVPGATTPASSTARRATAGQWVPDDANCIGPAEEFCERSHAISLDGALLARVRPVAQRLRGALHPRVLREQFDSGCRILRRKSDRPPRKRARATRELVSR